jgi:outer membrane protein OmpA-like peptidoglycan-associated protein
VYKKLPATIGVNTALKVLTSAQAKSQVLVARTPKVCFPLTTSVVVVTKGACSVTVKDKQSNKVLRTLYSKATASATVGTGITSSAAITFSAASWALSDAAKAQLAKLVTDANAASRIVVVGHAGSLYDNTAAYNQHISLFRAAAVKSALQKAGVKTAINVVALGSRAALTPTKSEAAQAQNRRVVLYFYP